MRNTLVIAGLAVIGLGALLWGTVKLSADLGNAIGGAGLLAYGLGALFTLLVGSGLFFLLFYSARKGYDEIDPPQDEGWP